MVVLSPAYIFCIISNQYISHFQHQTIGPVVFTVTVTVKVALDGGTLSTDDGSVVTGMDKAAS